MNKASARPNIIHIFADDMGYGDLEANNPASRIPTPNLNQLASQGMRFTDAHAGSAVCTPSRYYLMTGRYCWRSRLKHGIVWEWDGALLEEGRLTVAQLLRDAGYHTACIGKWHLGWDWLTKDGGHPNDDLPFGQAAPQLRESYHEKINFAERIGGGPIDRGFDTYFGVDVPNFSPYTWFVNDRVDPLPTDTKPPSMYGHGGGTAPMAPGWTLEAMIPEFTRKAVDLIETRDDADEPFFLYLPLTSPHSPVVPNEQFKGMSDAGNYGDFVCEVDWVVGQVMDALERTGQADHTLLIFTSDNGPERQTGDDKGAWQRIQDHGHYSMGPLRGMKRDAWEGGHRVPFVARWPGVTPVDTVCDQLITLGDLMATCAELTGTTLRDDQGEDSVSMLPLLLGQTDRPTRRSAVHHSCRGAFAIRRDDWVLIDDPTGADNKEPDWFQAQRGYAPHEQPGELYNLCDDLAERVNHYGNKTDLVAELTTLLNQVKGTGNGFSPDGAVMRDDELTE